MASIVLTLPNNKVIVVVAPPDHQIIPVQIYECECGCAQWFNPTEPHQIYLDADHKDNANNQKRRKTERRQKP